MTESILQPPQSSPAWDWQPSISALDAWIKAANWQPSEVVVLLPFAQMMNGAKLAWATAFPTSFVPRFETTRNWANKLHVFTPGPDDLSMDAAHDAAVSAAILASIELPGLDQQWRQTLAPQLVAAAQSLASVVSAVAPDQRAEWLLRKQAELALGTGDSFNKWESLLAALALNWAANSRYATDVLWQPLARQQCLGLALLAGLQADTLGEALLVHWQSQIGHSAVQRLPALRPFASDKPPARVYAALDAHDEASLAASCVLTHLQAGRVPVAIVAQDRLLTKRIHAQLQTAGVDWRDETGWMLSTTPIAAFLMSWLQASHASASANQLLDFVKAMPLCTEPSLSGVLATWEAGLRKDQVRRADQALARLEALHDNALAARVAQVLRGLMALATVQTPDEWRNALLRLLASCQWFRQWPDDDATHQVLRMLRLDQAAITLWQQASQQATQQATQQAAVSRGYESGKAGALVEGIGTGEGTEGAEGTGTIVGASPIVGNTQAYDALTQALSLQLSLPDGLRDAVMPWSVALAPLWRRMSVPIFMSWLRSGLEGASYKPDYIGRIEVSALPMAQLLGREVGAVVIAGCDATHMPAHVNAISLWTPEQQAVLGLPQAAQQTQSALDAWNMAVTAPVLDVLWRQTDGDQLQQMAPWLALSLGLDDDARDAQPNVASPWWQARTWAAGLDARLEHLQASQATPRPAPVLGAQTPKRLSASAYQTLRDCPYRFFAMQGLRLWDSAELDEAVDARDLGNWLHKVLQLFHEQRKPGTADTQQDAHMLDTLAEHVRGDMGFDAAQFLPFDGNWAQLRDGYLVWLYQHEANGFVFDSAEHKAQRTLRDHQGQQAEVVTITGTIDRIDHHLQTSQRMVLDYKTERLEKTQQRVKNALEDTQLAFYAALMTQQDDSSNAELQTAYLNVSGQDTKGLGATRLVAQNGGPELAVTVLQGVVHDITRLQQGQALSALGDGAVCDYCAARGLCRKDFWAQP